MVPVILKVNIFAKRREEGWKEWSQLFLKLTFLQREGERGGRNGPSYSES